MVSRLAPDTDDVYRALATVADPEIPAVSVVDLGIIENVVIEGDEVTISCLPTFVGCPALDVIKQDVERAVAALGLKPTVRFIYQPPWTSERISEEGRQKLAGYGLAPPSRGGTSVKLLMLSPGKCPYCGSGDTVLESPFGPTACRATCYCRACRNPYERFKDV